MSKLQQLHVFLNERLKAAAVEIFGAVEKTIAQYQEENERLRRLLQITPDIKLCRIDSLQLSLSVSEEEVPPEQQQVEQAWSPTVGEEDPEPTQIKEERVDLRTSQEEEHVQLQKADIIEFEFPPLCVKTEYDQEGPLQSLPLPQTQTVENVESDSEPVDTPFVTVTHLKGVNILFDPPGDNPNSAFSNSSAFSGYQVGHDNRPQLDPNPSLGGHCSKPGVTSEKTLCCRDCGETFARKAELQGHMTPAKGSPSECSICLKRYNSTCKLKAHVRFCHMEQPFNCPSCGMAFKQKNDLSKHMTVHDGETTFSCGNCGKSFYQKGNLRRHILTHTGEKPFSCVYCRKSFNQKGDLTKHIWIHTGQKPFGCAYCGKSFIQKGDLRRHILTHTGEKPFSCVICGKSFNQKGHLRRHSLTHTVEKQHSSSGLG